MPDRQIEILPYNSHWPLDYQEEAHQIQTVLDRYIHAIHHIGSTAIPNLPAKPVIDVMIEYKDIDDIETIRSQLQSMGYESLRRHVIPHWSFFTRKVQADISFHLHLRECGDPQIARHINFRDYLIQHADVATAYAELKKELAEKFYNDRYQYTLGKDHFVQAIDAKAKIWAGRNKHFAPANKGKEVWPQEKLINAMEANHDVYRTHFAQYLSQIQLIRVPGYTIINTGLANAEYNYILDADFTEEQAEEKVAEILAYFKNKIPCSWWVGVNDKPKNLAKYLINAGMQLADTYFGMYTYLHANHITLIEPTLTFKRALTADSLADYASLIPNADKFAMQYMQWIASIITEEDPIEYYVAYLNDQPIAKGVLVSFAQLAGIYSIAAFEEKYANAMRQFLLQRAKAVSYKTAVLHSTTEQLPLLQAAGFKQLGIFKCFNF